MQKTIKNRNFFVITAMIVPSMSNLEISNALFNDLPKLKIRANMLVPKMAKQFKRGGHFPAWKWAEYTHPKSRNHYLISFYAPTASQADNPIVKYVAFLDEDHQRIIAQWGCWMYRKRGSLENIATRYVGYYSGHFFSRYRERVWKDAEMTNNELICRYFSRNSNTIPLELNENIQRNYKEYGELAKYAFQVTDGTCFIRHWNEGEETSIGQQDCDFVSVVLYYTFVSGSMMSESQNKAISQEGTRYIRDYYRNLFEDAMKETVFGQLGNRHRNNISGNDDMPQMISIEECEAIGCTTEDKIFKNITAILNERHQTETDEPYLNQLAEGLSVADGTLQDIFPNVYSELTASIREEYRKLDELEQHCLFIYLFTNDKDEDEIVDSLCWRFEEMLLEKLYN